MKNNVITPDIWASQKKLDNGGGPPYDGDMELPERVAKIETILPTLATKADISELRADMHQQFHSFAWKMFTAMLTSIGLTSAIAFGIARLIH